MARIAVVGPGAVGGTIAAELWRGARHEIVLCARGPIDELIVTHDDETIAMRTTVLTDPAQASAVDWVLVATKTYDVTGAAAWLPGLRKNDAPLAVLQNGVEHRERFAAFVSPEKIVPVMVDCPAERASAARIRRRGVAKMAVADDRLGREFATLFQGTAVVVEKVPDFKSTVWRKLCLNAAGALSALTLRPAEVMHGEQIGEISRGLVRECIAVGRAEGATLEDALADSVLANYRGAPPDAMNSLHADRAAGRPMEVDARNGVIVRLGRKHGIPTPFNLMAVALLEAAR